MESARQEKQGGNAQIQGLLSSPSKLGQVQVPVSGWSVMVNARMERQAEPGHEGSRGPPKVSSRE